MKLIFFYSFFSFFCLDLSAQTNARSENIFIVTLDGFRWQEVFTGADSLLINNTDVVKDTGLMKQLYWDSDPIKRRMKLMPFFWNVIASKGQLYGNRLLDNKVNVKNFYQVSYPGYNEILTGDIDPRIVINLPRNNNNENILEYLNNEKEYNGKVVAFTSWKVFPYILNTDRNKLIINSGYNEMPNEDNDSTFKLIDKIQEDVVHKTNTRYDWLTCISAREYIEQNKPKIVFISLGETDEFAHHKKYDMYLQQATAIDKMIEDLWYYIQTSPFYKDKTTLIITTDHGRGKYETTWSTHNLLTKGSGQTWLALLGQGIVPLGEAKTEQQLYQKQISATVAMLLGQEFKTAHRVGAPIILPTSLQ
jgi:hypothetical protein